MEIANIIEKQGIMKRYAYALKAFIIGVLILVLLIPSVMIQELIRERQQLQQNATTEVSAKWANAQTLTGPLLVVPYTETNTKGEEIVRQAVLLPDQLTVNGELIPEIRKRGIYEVAVYNSKLALNGSFTALPPAGLNIPAGSYRWHEAVLAMGITDMRGIGSQELTWNGQPYVFNPGTSLADVLKSGVQTRVPLMPDSSAGGGAYRFSINLSLKGSGQVYFSPVGKTTRVNLQAAWPAPSFDGAFLPEKRQVDAKGFTASWQVLHLNRNFPQSWSAGESYDIHSSDFGVKLFLPVDGYLKSMRAVKYAILIIALTFLLFYFIELLQRYPVHPFQYILIGVALCIFYTLLISLAEQLNFNAAYLIATALTLSLVTIYAASVFRKTSTALAVGGTLLTLYGFIYVIIQSEDQALLMGSLGLFIILAIVMFFSRKIKWEAL